MLSPRLQLSSILSSFPASSTSLLWEAFLAPGLRWWPSLGPHPFLLLPQPQVALASLRAVRSGLYLQHLMRAGPDSLSSSVNKSAGKADSAVVRLHWPPHSHPSSPLTTFPPHCLVLSSLKEPSSFPAQVICIDYSIHPTSSFSRFISGSQLKCYLCQGALPDGLGAVTTCPITLLTSILAVSYHSLSSRLPEFKSLLGHLSAEGP